MITGPDPDAFAALLCDWCLEVHDDEQILIATTPLAEPLIRSIHRAVLQRGAWPLLRIAPPTITEDFYRYASAEQLDGFAFVKPPGRIQAQVAAHAHSPSLDDAAHLVPGVVW